MYSYYGDRVASLDNRLVLPSHSLLDLGARYIFKLTLGTASLRFAASNLTDAYYFDVLSANTYFMKMETSGSQFRS